MRTLLPVNYTLLVVVKLVEQWPQSSRCRVVVVNVIAIRVYALVDSRVG